MIEYDMSEMEFIMEIENAGKIEDELFNRIKDLDVPIALAVICMTIDRYAAKEGLRESEVYKEMNKAHAEVERTSGEYKENENVQQTH